jgi:eukaryotic-like serine/threonine-protein kinase
MSTLSPEQWQEVSPYLDKALAMSVEQRAAWLASLQAQNADLAASLQTLLDEHRVLLQEHFLEEGPVSLAGQPGLAGQTIGAYTLLSPIGQGGMGTVWLAERTDGRFERRTAVKFLSIGFAGGVERFKREGSILGRLAHPHIAELLDAGVSATGQPYLVLEHVDGEPIDSYCDQRKLGVEARVRLFLDVLAAVAHAHANLIVHRDIKPSNVLVRNDGQVKLLDFGIAKLLESEGQSASPTLLTREGGAALTPEYAAPEQVTGGAVTTATDVYGLGVLLYVLLTGQHPAGPGPHSPADLVKAIVDAEPPRASDTLSSPDAKAAAEKRSTTPDKLRRQLRGDLDTILGKALKKNPQERYSSVTALADDLRRYIQHEPIAARPDTIRYRAAKFARRNRTAVALATLTLLAVIAGAAGILVQARTAREQRDFAYRQLLRAEAVNDLNNFLLSDAAPSGKPFTASELLGRAERIVERQHGASDANRVDLLVSIGQQYRRQDEDGKSRRVLEEAYTLSRGLSDPSTRSKASCALADVLSGAGEQQRAEALFQEGLGELPQGPQYTLARVYCLLRGREVASHRGDSQAGLARVQAAQRLLDSSAFRSDLGDWHIFIDLAEAYRDAGQYREAIAAFEQASRLMTSLGRDETADAGRLYNNWALALFQIGRPLEAEPLFRRDIDISRADSTEAAVSPMTLLNYGRTLRELGRLTQAADYAERAYALAEQAKDEVVIDQSLIERARIYREQGDLAHAEAMLAEVEPRLRGKLPPGHYGFAGTASERSLISLARRDLENALRLANQAVAVDEAAIKAGGQGAGLLPIFLFRRSAIELEVRQTDAAVADATRAVNLLQAGIQPGTHSCNLGRAYLTLGRALQAQRKRDQARAAVRSAAEHLQSTLGPDHPETRAARQLGKELDAQPQ